MLIGSAQNTFAEPPELVIKREELRRLVEARDGIEEWAANSV
jgi:hypothetical protein